MRGPIRASRAMVIGAIVAVLLVGSLCGFLWFRNTSTIRALDAGRPLSAAPGETVQVELPITQCTGQLITFQRKGLFGRWQQTHLGQQRKIIPWFDLGSHSWDSTLGCSTGFTITVPADVTWSPVAACTIDLDCFVIDVTDDDD